MYSYDYITIKIFVKLKFLLMIVSCEAVLLSSQQHFLTNSMLTKNVG